MQAIEATGKVDSQGQIQLDRPLTAIAEQQVRIIILLSETDDVDEQEKRQRRIHCLHSYKM